VAVSVRRTAPDPPRRSDAAPRPPSCASSRSSAFGGAFDRPTPATPLSVAGGGSFQSDASGYLPSDCSSGGVLHAAMAERRRKFSRERLAAAEEQQRRHLAAAAASGRRAALQLQGTAAAWLADAQRQARAARAIQRAARRRRVLGPDDGQRARMLRSMLMSPRRAPPGSPNWRTLGYFSARC
jgi:hypothetical protein